jgi:hypothetical protein
MQCSLLPPALLMSRELDLPVLRDPVDVLRLQLPIFGYFCTRFFPNSQQRGQFFFLVGTAWSGWSRTGAGGAIHPIRSIRLTSCLTRGTL